MIFIIPYNQFIYQIYCSPTLFDKEPNNERIQKNLGYLSPVQYRLKYSN